MTDLLDVKDEFDGGLIFGNDMPALYAEVIMNWIAAHGYPEQMCYHDIAIDYDWSEKQLQQGLDRIESHFNMKLPAFPVTRH